PTQQGGSGGDNRRTILIAVIAVLVLAAGAFAVILATGDEEAEGQTVTFQPPTDRGPDPFTEPTDVRGRDKVRVGSGPFGGTGSDLVCDRELLIRSLRARPDRLREWARVVGIEPDAAAVARYIRRLRPVTLTVDTRITNHSFVNGSAVAFQSILQAGTAVLVDSSGRPIARCRCGNPLAEPIYVAEATCLKCPANYTPPPPCEDYARCWRRYPTPPPVRRFGPRPNTDDTFEEPAPQREPEPVGVPRASFSPRVGGPTDTYTLSFSNFPPNEQINIHLTRPDGVEEDYPARTDGNGDGSFTFPYAGNPVPGTYTAEVTAGPVIATAQTTVRDEGQGAPQEPEQQQEPEFGDVQCDPPRSQEEFERCRDAGLLPEQQGSG
ncbi:MAG: hypothetical protein M3320_10420, partial [Actinomycetota bacterium]|nr:hypothetical protein [Actinomycetota bacterium]